MRTSTNAFRRPRLLHLVRLFSTSRFGPRPIFATCSNNTEVNSACCSLSFPCGLCHLFGWFTIVVASIPSLPLYRLQLHLETAVADGMVAMGFTPQNYPPYGEQPGWKRGSYGWHGDDARKFNSCPFGKEVRGEKPWCDSLALALWCVKPNVSESVAHTCAFLLLCLGPLSTFAGTLEK